MPTYALTIKNNIKDVMMYKDDFEKVLDGSFRERGITVGVVHYELDSNHKLHIHTTIESDVPLRYKNHMIKGWHIYMRELKGPLANWIHYTTKEPRTYEQLLQARLEAMARDVNLFEDYMEYL